MTHKPLFFLFLIPLVVGYCVYLDYKNNYFCLGYGLATPICGDYNSVGNVQFVNATLRIPTSDIMQMVTRTNYIIGNQTSSIGDSGAPITIGTGNERKLIGMHTGKICEFTVPLVNGTLNVDVYSQIANVSVPQCVQDHEVANHLLSHENTELKRAYTVIVPWDLITTEFNLR